MDNCRVATIDNQLILAIETSGRTGSVVIAAGEKLLAEQPFSGPMRHSAEVFPAITGLLSRFGKKPADIRQVYISVGPGSFTGLRIAVTIAKTMALASQAKIVAVDTLDCIAAGAQDRLKDGEKLGVILDAKRSQFFVAAYQKDSDAGLQKILVDCLMSAEQFLAHFTDKTIALTGEGLVYYKNKFEAGHTRFLDENLWRPTAGNVYRLGWEKAKNDQFADALSLSPKYLRLPDAKPKVI